MELAPEVNRAFSAGGFRFYESWGAAPRLKMSVALLALTISNDVDFALSRLVNFG
jgi:hypothetical protein